ncbi:cryptococcal mannosyltransferase 1-domain-containing protein [Mycena vulgaris]|nr:cryptococcal mannosyltransferase 1-domain-containing protein [Mycena vulgaris]
MSPVRAQVVELRILIGEQRQISFALSLFLKTAFITLPLLFWFIHCRVSAYWLRQFPSGLFEPAWPAPRTQLVILMAVIPAWGAAMALGVVIWPMGKYLAARGMRWGLHDGPSYEGPAFVLGTYSENASAAMASEVTFMAMALGGLYTYVTYELPGDHRYKPAVEAALASPKPGGYHDGTKVFIAAIKVIHYLGRDNVFISIVESNSWDGTAEMLDDWKNTLDRLGVPHLIRIPRPDSATAGRYTPELTRRHYYFVASADMPGNVRMDFPSAVRNLALAPLVERGGYDVVLFSNDILTEAEGDGVVRDRLGRLVSSLWPYFLEDAGMEAVMEDEPAPVFACWNGIVAFRADPVLPVSLRTPGRLSTSPLSRPLPSTHPAYPQPASLTPALTAPLAFRSSAQNECFSSESIQTSRTTSVGSSICSAFTSTRA